MNNEQILAVVKQTQKEVGASADLASIIACNATQIAFANLPHNDDMAELADYVEGFVETRILQANVVESIQYLVEEAIRQRNN